MQNNNNEKLFKGASWYYARYRRGYPESFYQRIADVFNLDHSSRALDLGTGTGQIAITLSKLVKEVVAVDPELEMLNEGKKIAEQNGISNIIWTNIKAEDVSGELGSFDVTTMGASFHWMKQDEVLDRAYGITNAGGGVAIVSHSSSFHRNLGNDAWKDVVIDTIKKYLGEKRRAGKGYYNAAKEKYEDFLSRSKFEMLDTYREEYIQEWNIEQIIGFLYSTSYAAKWMFENRVDEFEEELKNSLLKIDTAGKFQETAFLEVLLGRK